MSYYFEVDGETVWNPALQPGLLFVAVAHRLADVLELPSGLAPGVDDICRVDVAVFGRFVGALHDRYFSSGHKVQRGLLRGVLLPSLVVLERADAPIVPADDGQRALREEALVLARTMAT
ncbi:hypothetical protein Lfu02_33820 [Longispora fulva]|uniref:Uncharacterized protein n=1 Tax=Longispora fulva TaxID=619741 RepID=A0A8J7GQC8_9ACTN|nr:DUF6086 family protein [Longispora fulva]MBG6141835.1 hypothetical protein [Longispora fulva]GIG59010.1 hypothetical protein Lfu02_33820 [Longispora fulva]